MLVLRTSIFQGATIRDINTILSLLFTTKFSSSVSSQTSKMASPRGQPTNQTDKILITRQPHEAMT